MTPDTELPFSLEREIVLHAPRELVFRYFTDSKRFAEWWGAGSTIDGRVGGKVHIAHPGGIVSSGTVLEIEANSRILFTYGFEGENPIIPPGGSRVTIVLRDAPGGTHLHLIHEVHEANARDQHVQGWRFQLSLFANAVANEAHAAADAVDAWFALWNESDDTERRRLLESATALDVVFLDRFSCLEGWEDLLAHLAATRIHMPGVRLERTDSAHHCQGTWLVGWRALSANGDTLGAGQNVFDLEASGKIRRVVGFWGA